MGKRSMSHNFNKSLASSHAAEDMPFWEETYRKAFPTMVAMINHRQDGDHQRLGIDRSVVLGNSKQITIDEKVRFKAYGDIALEYLSDRDRKVPGWVCKPLLCDYIAYAIAPIGECYLLPVIQLQAAWQRRKDVWMGYRTIVAENECNGRSWVTLSKPVKVQELFNAIGACLRVSFTPFGNQSERVNSTADHAEHFDAELKKLKEGQQMQLPF